MKVIFFGLLTLVVQTVRWLWSLLPWTKPYDSGMDME